MKYNRYTSHFIGLVHINLIVISTWQLCPMHICMLQVGRWCWHTNFAYYSCCIEMTLTVYVCISFLLVSADQIWVAIRVHISLVVVLILIIYLLNSEGLEPGPTYLSWSNMFFLQQPSLICKQIMCSIRFLHFSIFYVIKMHRIESYLYYSCSYVIYNIIIYVRFAFISFHFHVIELRNYIIENVL